MILELVLTFIVTLAIVGAISFVVTTYNPNKNKNKSKRLIVLLTQSSVITLLLAFVF